MRPLTLTQHSVRCPLEDRAARVTVRTHAEGAPSGRHVDVTECSLRPTPGFALPARRGYFSDVAPPLSYLCAPDPAPRHVRALACAGRCLAVLNAAEPGAAEPVRCTSGVSDALELARQVQSPGLTRVLWFHSA
jgi:hypothetical protein